VQRKNSVLQERLNISTENSGDHRLIWVDLWPLQTNSWPGYVNNGC